MLNQKKNVVGVLVDPATYNSAISEIINAARQGRAFTVSALAVHGVMTGFLDRQHRYRLNSFDLIVPDGQPVRWVLNGLHKAKLADRVYGPTLTRKLCAKAAEEGLPIYLYGSTQPILDDFTATMKLKHPSILFAGADPSKFRRLNIEEQDQLIAKINASGAAMLFVGLGCPRQEVFTFEVGKRLSMPVIAVGAAFPFLAGHIPQAPSWMQNRGLEWLYRLLTEPRRLWRRYLYLNPAFLTLVALQWFGLGVRSENAVQPLHEERYG